MQESTADQTSSYRFDQTRDVIWSQEADGFADVLHVFDADWHGIRNASGYAPGHKFTISHKQSPDENVIRYLTGMLFKHDIRHVIFQGYSPAAHEIARELAKERPNGVRMLAVSHVTSAQFDNPFEPSMLGLLRHHKQDGILDKIASVKPEFHRVVPFCETGLIYNFPPSLAGHRKPAAGPKETGSAFVPVENTFRKNLYTNLVAGLECDAVARIYSVNSPAGLDGVRDISKIKVVGFHRRAELFNWMARVQCVLNVSFAECQPMTNLEALAAGTPCLTGQLNLPVVKELELSRLSEISLPDEPSVIVGRLYQILEMQQSGSDSLDGLIQQYLSTQIDLATQSYRRLIHGGS